MSRLTQTRRGDCTRQPGRHNRFMCGFFGMIGDKWAKDFPRAVASLAHRGPDDEGIWHEQNVWLGHRRLSVIDLDGGHQPMSTQDGRYWIVFNGEIYNFRDLRKDLERDGIVLTTRSDTEVLLNGYVQWGGQALLKRLDGMFAFAVWDRYERQLFAARDRFGIKPFFYSQANGLVFGSTLEPFWMLNGFDRRVNYQAIRDYLACQSIMAPMTILQHVHSLEPASWLTWDAHQQRLQIKKYWDIPKPVQQTTSLDDLIHQTDHAVRTSVQRQLVADVPIGAFLSGGIDSSLMVYYMSTATTGPVRTFSVRFPQRQDYDESIYAKAVANRFGCVHQEINAEEIDSTALTTAIRALDQPLADPAYLTTLGLAYHTRQHVTVAISGDGGDELFGGYQRYLQDESSYPAHRGAQWWQWGVSTGILPSALLRRGLRGQERVLWDRVRVGPWKVGRKSMKRLLTDQAWTTCHSENTLERWHQQVLRWNGVMDTDSLMRGDLWTYLSENCLVKTDRASMQHSLEVRVPLLGNPVTDLILSQHASVKTTGGLKSILVALAKQHLPQEVWDRPKHGFSVPLKDYFRGPWQETCQQWVDASEELAPFLNAQAVREQWRRTCQHSADHRLMYTLIVLLAWLETHPLEIH